ncbi:hypothetical protein ACIRP3_44015 [Streptomyces sp. NPDC101209]|uniref:ATP-dependent DNA ligase n=1 Tax=Streptomyces sp. NPDC101209 TaxID=3366129 RepID=UPI00380B23CB
MLTTAVPGLGLPPRSAAEPKWDGWRCQIHTATRRMWSRHGTEVSRQFSDVTTAAAGVPDAVLDGELVAVLTR